MKHAIAALAFLAATTAAQAGSLADPVVTPTVIAEEAVATGSSSAEVTLLIFAMMAMSALK